MTPRAAPAGLAVLVAVLVACTPPVARTEVTRLPSPDGRLDAVVEVTDAGATTAPGFFVHLLARGAVPERDRQVLRVVGACCDAAGRYGIDVRWTAARELAVRYGEARFADPAAPVLTATVDEPDGTSTSVTVVVRGPSGP